MENKYLKKPWIRLYETLALPETFEPYPERSYTEYHLDEPARKYPNSLALVQFDYEMTYKELKEHVDRFATALTDLGVKKGDVVATGDRLNGSRCQEGRRRRNGTSDLDTTCHSRYGDTEDRCDTLTRKYNRLCGRSDRQMHEDRVPGGDSVSHER